MLGRTINYISYRKPDILPKSDWIANICPNNMQPNMYIRKLHFMSDWIANTGPSLLKVTLSESNINNSSNFSYSIKTHTQYKLDLYIRNSLFWECQANLYHNNSNISAVSRSAAFVFEQNTVVDNLTNLYVNGL